VFQNFGTPKVRKYIQVCNACNFKHTITNNYFAIGMCDCYIHVSGGVGISGVNYYCNLKLKLRLFSLPNTLNLKAISKEIDFQILL
jgi:hypothetical protein